MSTLRIVTFEFVVQFAVEFIGHSLWPLDGRRGLLADGLVQCEVGHLAEHVAVEENFAAVDGTPVGMHADVAVGTGW